MLICVHTHSHSHTIHCRTVDAACLLNRDAVSIQLLQHLSREAVNGDRESEEEMWKMLKHWNIHALELLEVSKIASLRIIQWRKEEEEEVENLSIKIMFTKLIINIKIQKEKKIHKNNSIKKPIITSNTPSLPLSLSDNYIIQTLTVHG